MVTRFCQGLEFCRSVAIVSFYDTPCNLAQHKGAEGFTSPLSQLPDSVTLVRVRVPGRFEFLGNEKQSLQHRVFFPVDRESHIYLYREKRRERKNGEQTSKKSIRKRNLLFRHMN